VPRMARGVDPRLGRSLPVRARRERASTWRRVAYCELRDAGSNPTGPAGPPPYPDRMDQPDDARDTDWERCHLYALFADNITGCGCNQPETAYYLVRDILDLVPFHDDGNWLKVQALIGSDGAFQIVI